MKIQVRLKEPEKQELNYNINAAARKEALEWARRQLDVRFGKGQWKGNIEVVVDVESRMV